MHVLFNMYQIYFLYIAHIFVWPLSWRCQQVKHFTDWENKILSSIHKQLKLFEYFIFLICSFIYPLF